MLEALAGQPQGVGRALRPRGAGQNARPAPRTPAWPGSLRGPRAGPEARSIEPAPRPFCTPAKRARPRHAQRALKRGLITVLTGAAIWFHPHAPGGHSPGLAPVRHRGGHHPGLHPEPAAHRGGGLHQHQRHRAHGHAQDKPGPGRFRQRLHLAHRLGLPVRPGVREDRAWACASPIPSCGPSGTARSSWATPCRSATSCSARPCPPARPGPGASCSPSCAA